MCRLCLKTLCAGQDWRDAVFGAFLFICWASAGVGERRWGERYTERLMCLTHSPHSLMRLTHTQSCTQRGSRQQGLAVSPMTLPHQTGCKRKSGAEAVHVALFLFRFVFFSFFLLVWIDWYSMHEFCLWLYHRVGVYVGKYMDIRTIVFIQDKILCGNHAVHALAGSSKSALLRVWWGLHGKGPESSAWSRVPHMPFTASLMIRTRGYLSVWLLLQEGNVPGNVFVSDC